MSCSNELPTGLRPTLEDEIQMIDSTASGANSRSSRAWDAIKIEFASKSPSKAKKANSITSARPVIQPIQ